MIRLSPPNKFWFRWSFLQSTVLNGTTVGRYLKTRSRTASVSVEWVLGESHSSSRSSGNIVVRVVLFLENRRKWVEMKQSVVCTRIEQVLLLPAFYKIYFLFPYFVENAGGLYLLNCSVSFLQTTRKRQRHFPAFTRTFYLIQHLNFFSS
jgi:hypothetical protein